MTPLQTRILQVVSFAVAVTAVVLANLFVTDPVVLQVITTGAGGLVGWAVIPALPQAQ